MNFDPHHYLLVEEFDIIAAGIKHPNLKSHYTGSLFISHIGIDYKKIGTDIVYPIINERFGTSFFFHNRNSGYVGVYKELVRIAIHLCDKFIVAISNASVSNEWVLAEVAFALMKKRSIILCLLDDTDPRKLNRALTANNKLINQNIIDFTKNVEDAKSKLANVLDKILIQYPYPRLPIKINVISQPPI